MRAVSALQLEKVGTFVQICSGKTELSCSGDGLLLQHHALKVQNLCLVISFKIAFHHHSTAVGLRELEFSFRKYRGRRDASDESSKRSET